MRLLGTILCRVLVETVGPELLDDVERLRKATIAFRGVPNDRRRRVVTDIVDGFDPIRAEQVARAFTVYFQLVNLAEEHPPTHSSPVDQFRAVSKRLPSREARAMHR